MAILLEKLFLPQQVVPDLATRDQSEALREVSASLSANKAMCDAEKFLADLLAREELQSTAAGNGIAFPHARSDSVDEIMIALGRSRPGVPFAKTGELVHLIFVIGTPMRMVSDYLVCIGALVRLLKNSDLRKDLMRASTAPQLIEILRSAAAPAA